MSPFGHVYINFRFKRMLGQIDFESENLLNTGLAAPGALAYRLQRRTACNAAPPATPHRVPVGPKMADGVWKGVYP